MTASVLAAMSIGVYIAESRQLPYPTLVKTQTGFVIEQVHVGQSCLVLVHRGQAPDDPIAVVPCE